MAAPERGNEEPPPGGAARSVIGALLARPFFPTPAAGTQSAAWCANGPSRGDNGGLVESGPRRTPTGRKSH